MTDETKPCGCRAWDPVENAHTEAEHQDCGGGYDPSSACGGCDSCVSGQIAYYERLEAKR